jgi:hypothetical protein
MKPTPPHPSHLAKVRQDGLAIQHVPPEQRSPEVCLAAVQQNGRAIQHLSATERTTQVRLAAVRSAADAVRFLGEDERTPEVCLAAVQRSGWAVELLNDEQRSPGVCLAAVQHSGGMAIQCLSPEQRSPEVCLAAVTKNFLAIRHLTTQELSCPQMSQWAHANWHRCTLLLEPGAAQELAHAIRRPESANDAAVHAGLLRAAN